MPLPYPYSKARDPLAIPSGLLRHQVSIQKPSAAQDSLGTPTGGWQTVFTTLASVEDVKAAEGVDRMSEGWYSPAAQVTHLVRLRWPGASVPVAAGYQVLFAGRALKVQFVTNVQQRNRVLLLGCLEVNAVL
jgi:head-tail adaptor